MAGCDGAGMVERSHPASEVRVGDGMSHSVPEARGGSREEQPCARGWGWRPGRATHSQGAAAALAQEGLEELSYVEGQEGGR